MTRNLSDKIILTGIAVDENKKSRQQDKNSKKNTTRNSQQFICSLAFVSQGWYGNSHGADKNKPEHRTVSIEKEIKGRTIRFFYLT